MKGMRIGLVLSCVVMVAACVPKRQPPPPAPSPAPPVQQPRPVLPPPPPPPANWRDVPLSPGNWMYRRTADASQALFGLANSEAQFLVRCDLARRQVSLWRQGRGATGAMTIRTTENVRSLPATIQPGAVPYVSAALTANDRVLDFMAFTRGRFTVEVAGLPTLVVPSWAEPARVVEDCRG